MTVALPPCGPCSQDNHEKCVVWWITNKLNCPCYKESPEIHQHQTA